MEFSAKKETIEKIKNLFGKKLYRDGEEGQVSLLHLEPYDCDHTKKGDAAVVWLIDSDGKYKFEYLYEGEKGLQQLLKEWKEK